MTRTGRIMMICFTAFAASVSVLFRPGPKLIWNASASAPIGFYTVHPISILHSGELVLVKPPTAIASFLDRRGYLPMGVPLLKQVLALPGQSVCRFDRTITIDGVAVGEALDRDRLGRHLPGWQGCRIVAEGEAFLMNWQSENSFDGRYFGPLPASAIVGRATPLWIEKDD